MFEIDFAPPVAAHSSGGASARPPTARGAKNPSPTRFAEPLLKGVRASPYRHAGVVLDVSDDESAEDDSEFVRLAAPARPPTTPTPVPSLIGNGGHIFRTPAPQPPLDPTPSTDTETRKEYPDFAGHRHLLRYRGRRVDDAQILHPAEDELGDNDGWYYVTIGRNVGVFNAW